MCQVKRSATLCCTKNPVALGVQRVKFQRCTYFKRLHLFSKKCCTYFPESVALILCKISIYFKNICTKTRTTLIDIDTNLFRNHDIPDQCTFIHVYVLFRNIDQKNENRYSKILTHHICPNDKLSSILNIPLNGCNHIIYYIQIISRV